MRTVARVENFRDRSRPEGVPDKPADTRPDRAADRPDTPTMKFADGSRVRWRDLELSPDAKPPPRVEDPREAYLREYKKQLAPADTRAAMLPDELGSASASVEQGPLADKVQAVRDKARIAADSLLSGDKPDETALRIDRPWADDPYADAWPPSDYRSDALDDADGNRMPLFDGKPKREDTEQGRIGDCGVIASIGALAGTKPDKIADAITPNPDGTYSVRLYRASSAYHDGMTSTPGQPYTFTVTPDLPVRKDKDGDLTKNLTGAVADSAAWPAIMEKAIAGSDQAWTPEQKQAYEARWELQKAARNEQRAEDGEPPLPDGPVPTGYVRLNQGTTAWDRAEILTSITGRQSEVRPIPDGDDELVKNLFADKIAYDKPVLVGSRRYDDAAGEREFPHTLEASHVYEVTGINRDNRIELRNPWNDTHPDPLTFDEFREYFRRKNADGSRAGHYTTLT